MATGGRRMARPVTPFLGDRQPACARPPAVAFRPCTANVTEWLRIRHQVCENCRDLADRFEERPRPGSPARQIDNPPDFCLGATLPRLRRAEDLAERRGLNEQIPLRYHSPGPAGAHDLFLRNDVAASLDQRPQDLERA